MKRSHARIVTALKNGATVTRLHLSRVVWVSVWISYGKYRSFKVRAATIREMEATGTVHCVDQYAQDQEWVLAKPIGKPLIEVIFDS